MSGSSNLDFSKILDVPAGDLKKLPPIPVGTYYCRIGGVHKVDERGKENEKVPVIQFQAIIQKPLDDVDQVALAEYREATPIEGKPIRCEFWWSDNQKYLFKNWLVDVLGISDEGGTRRIGEMMAEVPGKSLLVKVTHRNYKNRNNEMETAVEAREYARV